MELLVLEQTPIGIWPLVGFKNNRMKLSDPFEYKGYWWKQAKGWKL